jgi:hypothetical protein
LSVSTFLSSNAGSRRWPHYEADSGRHCAKVAADEPYRNTKQNTPNTARIELDAALMRVIGPLLKDDTEFYKQFLQNESVTQFFNDMVQQLTQGYRSIIALFTVTAVRF